MSAFKSERDADAFVLRAKHREWDDSDIEAVWDEARTSLIVEGNRYLTEGQIIDRCCRILENRND